MIIKKISVFGLVFALATTLIIQPLIGFAQTATSSNENTASPSQATSTETTSTSTATSTSTNNNTSSAATFALVSSQLVNSPSGIINQGSVATIQAVVESQNAASPDTIVEMTVLNQNNIPQGATTTLSNQNFPANEPVTFQATSSPNLLPGAYHLSLSIFSSGHLMPLTTFQDVQDFTVATSSATTNTSSLAISSVSGVSSQDGTGVTISWVTNQDANSQVAFGTSTNYSASSSLDSSLVMNHSVDLSGLTPSTLYHFQVMSTDASGTLATSTDQTFSTNNGTSTELVNRIIDLQTQVVALLQQKVQQLISDINSGILRTQ